MLACFCWQDGRTALHLAAATYGNYEIRYWCRNVLTTIKVSVLLILLWTKLSGEIPSPGWEEFLSFVQTSKSLSLWSFINDPSIFMSHVWICCMNWMYLLALFCWEELLQICSSIVVSSSRHTISAATNIQQRSSADRSKHKNTSSSIILNNVLRWHNTLVDKPGNPCW